MFEWVLDLLFETGNSDEKKAYLLSIHEKQHLLIVEAISYYLSLRFFCWRGIFCYYWEMPEFMRDIGLLFSLICRFVLASLAVVKDLQRKLSWWWWPMQLRILVSTSSVLRLENQMEHLFAYFENWSLSISLYLCGCVCISRFYWLIFMVGVGLRRYFL